MIRGLVLQYLYQLSDPQLEDQLIDRFSFRRFVGLPLDQSVPDFTTFWRFREALAEEELLSELFAEINRQLEAKGLLLKQGTVVDASIIASSNRPLSDKNAQNSTRSLPARSTPMPIQPKKAYDTTLAIRVTSGWILAAS